MEQLVRARPSRTDLIVLAVALIALGLAGMSFFRDNPPEEISESRMQLAERQVQAAELRAQTARFDAQAAQAKADAVKVEACKGASDVVNCILIATERLRLEPEQQRLEERATKLIDACKGSYHGSYGTLLECYQGNDVFRGATANQAKEACEVIPTGIDLMQYRQECLRIFTVAN